MFFGISRTLSRSQLNSGMVYEYEFYIMYKTKNFVKGVVNKKTKSESMGNGHEI